MIYDTNNYKSIYESDDELTGDAKGDFDMADVEPESAGSDVIEDPVLEHLAIVMKMETNWTKLQEATGMMELAAIQEGVAPTAIYEGAGTDRIKAWFSSAKEFIKKWAGYIKGFFAKALAMLQSLFGDSAKFVSQHGKRIENAKNVDKIKVEGFVYTIDKISPTGKILGKVLVETSKAMINMSSDNDNDTLKKVEDSYIDKKLNSIRGAICNDRDVASTKAMRLKLYMNFRDNQSAKRSLTIKEIYDNPKNMLNAVSESKNLKNKANYDYLNAKESLNQSMKSITTMYNNVVKDARTNRDSLMYNLNKALGMIRTLLSIENAAHAEHIRVLKESHNQALRCCRRVLAKGTNFKTDYDKGSSYVESSSDPSWFDEVDSESFNESAYNSDVAGVNFMNVSFE